jgi:CRP-like cAMP-binding protein
VVTGALRQATVQAATAAQLLSVGREAMQQILEKAPGLAERIGAVLVERQAELDVRAVPTEEKVDAGTRTDLVDRIKRFFAL